MKKYNSDFKLKVVTKYLSGNFTMNQICQEFGIAKATVHKWVKQFKDNSSLIFSESSLSGDSKKKKEEKLKEKEISNLYKKIGQLTVERDFLKKSIGHLDYQVRIKYLKSDKDNLSVRTKSRLLGINRSNIYYKPRNLFSLFLRQSRSNV